MTTSAPGRSWARALATSEEMWDRVIGVNLKGSASTTGTATSATEQG